MLIKSMEALEGAAAALDKTLDAYSRQWQRLLVAAETAQQQLASRRDRVRQDLNIPPIKPLQML